MAIQTNVRQGSQSKLKRPSFYRVIMYNDDFTTMDFVVEILITIFRKAPQEAAALMMTVHKSGSAAVGTYSYDIARTKVEQAEKKAREEGFPFRMAVEEE